MSRISRKNLSWALVVVFVLAAVLVPAAGARTGGGVQPTSPWYAYDQALRNAQHLRHEQSVRAQLANIQPTSPWYAYDEALRRAQHERHQQNAVRHLITDTLGGNGTQGDRTVEKASGTRGFRSITNTVVGSGGGTVAKNA